MKMLMLILMMVMSPAVLAMTPEETLFNNPATPHFGAKNPRLTIVSFTDYNCPYCKQFDPLLARVVKENPQVAVVIKLLPFRGASSIIAGRAAMTVWEQHPDKFLAVHQRLMSKKGPHDEASAVERLGLQPQLVCGGAQNFKITYPEDLALAEAVLQARLGRTD